MIAVDTNVLVYAHRGDSPFNDAAYSCVNELAEGSAPWAIPWPCVAEFVCTVTHPRIYRPPTPLAQAIEQLDEWLASSSVSLLAEPEQHWPVFRQLVLDRRIVGPVVYDARIAAICLQHGVRELWSADRDFGRFPEIKVVNPLIRARP